MTMPAAGKAVGRFIDAMRGMRLVLALVGVTLSLAGLLFYQSKLFNDERRAVLLMQGEVQKLLSQCIVPPPARPQ